MTTTALPRISATELAVLLDSGADVELLDVRSPAEYESAHIPGAYNVPVDVVLEHARRIHQQVTHPVVLVCQSGPRAAQACQRLQAEGLEQVQILEGGMGRWDDGSRSVRRGQQRWALERQVRLVAGSLVLTGIAASLVKPRAKFLAGGIGAGLTFSALTNTCAMGNVLSRLPYNRGRAFDVEKALAGLGR